MQESDDAGKQRTRETANQEGSHVGKQMHKAAQRNSVAGKQRSSEAGTCREAARCKEAARWQGKESAKLHGEVELREESNETAKLVKQGAASHGSKEADEAKTHIVDAANSRRGSAGRRQSSEVARVRSIEKAQEANKACAKHGAAEQRRRHAAKHRSSEAAQQESNDATKPRSCFAANQRASAPQSSEAATKQWGNIIRKPK